MTIIDACSVDRVASILVFSLCHTSELVDKPLKRRAPPSWLRLALPLFPSEFSRTAVTDQLFFLFSSSLTSPSFSRRSFFPFDSSFESLKKTFKKTQKIPPEKKTPILSPPLLIVRCVEDFLSTASHFPRFVAPSISPPALCSLHSPRCIRPILVLSAFINHS